MKPEIEVLKVIEAETKQFEKGEKSEAKKLMLAFRGQEIRNVLQVAKLWDENPPTKQDPQESLDDYLKATLYVAESIRRMLADNLYMGSHGKHFEREWNGRQDWKDNE